MKSFREHFPSVRTTSDSEDSPEVLAAKLEHANQLRMWHSRQGRDADPNVPPPKLKLPEPR
jgi:hypothetical protein